MSKKSESKLPKLPKIIETFFWKLRPPKDTPNGLVYVGSKTESDFNSFPWKTKVKIPIPAELLEGNEVKHYIYVPIEDVIRYILSSSTELSNLTPDQKAEVKEYVSLHGLNLSEKIQPKPDKGEADKKTAKPGKPRKPKKPPKVEIKLEDKPYKGNIYRQVEIDCRNEHPPVKNPFTAEAIKPDNGKRLFAEIDSPHEHEHENGVKWLVLADQLPKVFGRSVSSWHQILGHNPLG